MNELDGYIAPEDRARVRIDAMLVRAGWVVQDYRSVNLYAGRGVAVRELVTAAGLADYVLFVDRHAVGVIEANARAVEVPSIHAHGTQLRTTLTEKGLLVEAGPHLRLTEDYVFASPSTAAMIMLGRTSSGRVEWKTADGRTLKELQTADTASEAP